MSSDSREQQQQERPVQTKRARETEATVRPPAPALQARGRGRKILRRGKPIPAGAAPVPTAANSVDGTVVVSKLSEMSRYIWRGGRNFNGTVIERQVLNAFGTNNLQPRSIPLNFYDESGINKIWSGTVNIRMESERAIDTNEGTVGGAGGGTGGHSTGTSAGRETGGEVGGGVGGHEGAPSASASGSAKTSSGESEGTTGTGSATTTVGASRDKVVRYECTIVADITLRVEEDFSGTDYINPFKWGFSAVSAAIGDKSTTASVACGQWTYAVSGGMMAPAPK
jgi:hypothetical protein